MSKLQQVLYPRSGGKVKSNPGTVRSLQHPQGLMRGHFTISSSASNLPRSTASASAPSQAQSSFLEHSVAQISQLFPGLKIQPDAQAIPAYTEISTILPPKQNKVFTAILDNTLYQKFDKRDISQRRIPELNRAFRNKQLPYTAIKDPQGKYIIRKLEPKPKTSISGTADSSANWFV